MLSCDDCDRSYKNKNSLKTHRSVYHKNIRDKPYPTGKYKCNHCHKRFNQLSALYRHKQKGHHGFPIKGQVLGEPKDVIALVNHPSHDEKADSSPDKPAEQPVTDNDSEISFDLPPTPRKNNSKPDVVKQRVTDTDSEISFDLPEDKQKHKKVKRRVSDTDSEISFDLPPTPRKHNSEDKQKPKGVKRRVKKKKYNSEDEEYDDSEDEAPKYTSRIKHLKKYKTLYEKCRRDFEKYRRDFQKELDEKDKINADLEETYRRRLIEKENTIIDLNSEKEDFKKRNKFLRKHISEFDADKPPRFNKISKALINCVSIGEINKIRKLFQEKRYSRLYRSKNVKILQRIFIGLNNGVIPICNPQSTAISDQQRKVIDQIEESSTIEASQILENNLEIVIQLFEVIDRSIKMVVDLYYQYGSKDEYAESDSDFDESEEKDESDTDKDDSTQSDEDDFDESEEIDESDINDESEEQAESDINEDDSSQNDDSEDDSDPSVDL